MCQPRPRCGEDGVGDCRCHNRRCRVTKAHRHLRALDKADVEDGHIAKAPPSFGEGCPQRKSIRPVAIRIGSRWPATLMPSPAGRATARQRRRIQRWRLRCPTQHHRVVPVGRHPVASLHRDKRRRDDHAVMPDLGQLPVQAIAARADFIAEMGPPPSFSASLRT